MGGGGCTVDLRNNVRGLCVGAALFCLLLVSIDPLPEGCVVYWLYAHRLKRFFRWTATFFRFFFGQQKLVAGQRKAEVIHTIVLWGVPAHILRTLAGACSVPSCHCGVDIR